MSFPILYSFRRCPYAIRARLAILASGATVELREVSLAYKPAQMISASPKGTIPVFVLPNGAVLEESLDIMIFALEKNDPLDWLSSVSAQNAAMIDQIDGSFKYHLDRYKYPDRYEDNKFELHREAALSILAPLNDRLKDTAFLAGTSFSLIDAAILPFVRQYAAVDPGWFANQPLPGLQNWLATFLDSDLFNATMLNFPVWQDGDKATFFGAEAAL